MIIHAKGTPKTPENRKSKLREMELGKKKKDFTT